MQSHKAIDAAEIDRLDKFKNSMYTLVGGTYEFMRAGDQLSNVEFGDDPAAPHRKARRSWLADKDEGEVGEFLDADFANDIVEYIDGAIDTAVISAGAVVEAVGGRTDIAEILFAEVVRSNLSKIDPITGEVLKTADGKIQKGIHYSPPRIREILEYFGVPIPEQTTMKKTYPVNRPVNEQPTHDAVAPIMGDYEGPLNPLTGKKIK